MKVNIEAQYELIEFSVAYFQVNMYRTAITYTL